RVPEVIPAVGAPDVEMPRVGRYLDAGHEYRPTFAVRDEVDRRLRAVMVRDAEEVQADLIGDGRDLVRVAVPVGVDGVLVQVATVPVRLGGPWQAGALDLREVAHR